MNKKKKRRRKKETEKIRTKKASSLSIGNINIQQQITLVMPNNNWILSHPHPMYILNNGLFQKKIKQGGLKIWNF